MEIRCHAPILRGRPAIILDQITAIQSKLGKEATANLLGIKVKTLDNHYNGLRMHGSTVRAAQYLYTMLFAAPGQRIALVDILTSYRYSPANRKPGKIGGGGSGSQSNKGVKPVVGI